MCNILFSEGYHICLPNLYVGKKLKASYFSVYREHTALSNAVQNL